VNIRVYQYFQYGDQAASLEEYHRNRPKESLANRETSEYYDHFQGLERERMFFEIALMSRGWTREDWEAYQIIVDKFFSIDDELIALESAIELPRARVLITDPIVVASGSGVLSEQPIVLLSSHLDARLTRSCSVADGRVVLEKAGLYEYYVAADLSSALPAPRSGVSLVFSVYDGEATRAREFRLPTTPAGDHRVSVCFRGVAEAALPNAIVGVSVKHDLGAGETISAENIELSMKREVVG
jgi:hypothetical protein